MARHADRSRVRAAGIEGAVQGVRDALGRAEAVELDELRLRWPALWEALQRLEDALDVRVR